MNDTNTRPVPHSARTERLARQGCGPSDKWIEFEVETYSHCQLETRTLIRATKDADPFIDIAITEYTGTSRRAKLASVRLGEAGARRLYEALKGKFSTEQGEWALSEQPKHWLPVPPVPQGASHAGHPAPEAAR